MRLVQVTQRPALVQRQRKRHARRWLSVVLVLFSLMFVQLLRPLPDAHISVSLPKLPKSSEVQLTWPSGGQASVAAEGYGVLALHGAQQPLATASIAKVITALCVLEKHPLQGNEQGPTLTMSSRDVGLYEQQIEQNGSRLPVTEGQQLTERQALEAIMIPSANNIADTLAVWAFGSQSAYADHANAYLERNGLVHTRVGSDASGYDASTVSTAEDLAKLGKLARKNSVLMSIAGQKKASLGESGTFKNYNTALGGHGINGLKTGNNDQNPGALLFTADIPKDGTVLQLTGSVMGAASLTEAIEASETLVASTGANFETVPYAQPGQVVGVAHTAWGSSAQVKTRGAVQLIRWKTAAMTEEHTLHATRATAAGSVGALAVHAGEVQASTSLEITTPATGPNLWWRLTRLR